MYIYQQTNKNNHRQSRSLPECDKMKKIIIVLLTVLLLCTIPLSIMSHPGGTDGKGGHRSPDGYHYHHGYPAHDHTDLDGDGKKDCPYDFKDNTKNNSGSGNNDNSADSKSGTNANKISLGKIVLIIIATVVPLFLIVRLVILKLIERKHEKERRIREEQEFLKEKRIMTQQYGGRPISDFVEIPSDSEIGEDNLPRIKNTTQFWGIKYTFYLSSTGKYHYSNCAYAKHKTPVNAYTIKRYRSLSSCCHCKPNLPNMDWVDEYLRIKAIKERYHIDTPE